MSEEKDEHIGKSVNPMLSSDEREALKKDLTEEEIADFQRAWQVSGKFSPPTGKTKMERWADLENSLEEEPVIMPLYTSSSFRKAAGFVSIALVFLIALFYLKPSEIAFDQSEITHLGETKTINLPDGSVIEMNAESTIEYSSSEFENDRMIKLKGEAFFEVAKSESPFQVVTNGTTVEVLGTSFNVNNRDERVEVSCLTGKVSVRANSKQTELTKGLGTSVISGNGPSPVFNIEAEQIGSWRRDEFYFTDTPLDRVFSEIGRQFSITIESEYDFRQTNFTGFFTGEDLEKSLAIVCLSAGLKYEIKQNKVVVY